MKTLQLTSHYFGLSINIKMEAAYNYTDAVIENKCYSIEESNCLEDTYFIVIKYLKSKVNIAIYDVRYDIMSEALPIRYSQQQTLKVACKQYDKELKEAKQKEKELQAEFEAWKKSKED